MYYPITEKLRKQMYQRNKEWLLKAKYKTFVDYKREIFNVEDYSDIISIQIAKRQKEKKEQQKVTSGPMTQQEMNEEMASGSNSDDDDEPKKSKKKKYKKTSRK